MNVGVSLASSGRKLQGQIFRQMGVVTDNGCGHSATLFKGVKQFSKSELKKL